MTPPPPVRRGSARKTDVLRELDATQRFQEAARKAAAPKGVLQNIRAAKHRVFRFLDFDNGELTPHALAHAGSNLSCFFVAVVEGL